MDFKKTSPCKPRFPDAEHVRWRLSRDYKRTLPSDADEGTIHRAWGWYLFQMANCPTRHSENIQNLDLVESPAAWSAHLDLLDARAESGFLVALLGTRGTGKTQMATALIRRCCDRGIHCRYCRTPDLFSEIRRTFNREHRGDSEGEIVDRLANTELLVLDEFHQRGGSEFEQNILINLIDKRYADVNKATLLNANATRPQFAALAGDSIVSRLHETGTVLETTWPSFRIPGQWESKKN